MFDRVLNTPLPSPSYSCDWSYEMDWLLVSERVAPCIAATVFRYWNGIVPSYINDIFQPSPIKHNTWSQMASHMHPVSVPGGGLLDSPGKIFSGVRPRSKFYTGEIKKPTGDDRGKSSEVNWQIYCVNLKTYIPHLPKNIEMAM